MIFKEQIFTKAGLETLARVSSQASLFISRVIVVADGFSDSLNDAEQPMNYWLERPAMGLIATIESATANFDDKGHARLVIRIKNENPEEDIPFAGIVLCARTIESGVESDEDTFCLLGNDEQTIVPSYDQTKTTIGVVFNFAFSNEANILINSVENPDIAMVTDLDRFLSCHKVGAPEVGDDQSIYGIKAFRSPVYFHDAAIHEYITEFHDDVRVTGNVIDANGVSVCSATEPLQSLSSRYVQCTEITALDNTFVSAPKIKVDQIMIGEQRMVCTDFFGAMLCPSEESNISLGGIYIEQGQAKIGLFNSAWFKSFHTVNSMSITDSTYLPQVILSTDGSFTDTPGVIVDCSGAPSVTIRHHDTLSGDFDNDGFYITYPTNSDYDASSFTPKGLTFNGRKFYDTETGDIDIPEMNQSQGVWKPVAGQIVNIFLQCDNFTGSPTVDPGEDLMSIFGNEANVKMFLAQRYYLGDGVGAISSASKQITKNNFDTSKYRLVAIEGFNFNYQIAMISENRRGTILCQVVLK